MQSIGVYTQPLSAAMITIARTDNVREVSIMVTSGTVTLKGNQSFRGTASLPISLAAGQTITVSSPYGQGVLGDIVIDGSAGVAQIIMLF